MNLEQAIRIVVGQDTPMERVLAIGQKCIENGKREPMPSDIENAVYELDSQRVRPDGPETAEGGLIGQGGY